MGTTAALVGGGGLVEAIVESAKAGAAQETAIARLGKAVTNAGISWKGHREEVEKWIESTARAKGFMDTDLSNAYANMIRTTGSVTEAQTLLNDAMDISRTKGVDLSWAQSLLARVYNGSYMGLKRFGIAITPVTTAQEALKTATAHLNAEQKHQIDLIRERTCRRTRRRRHRQDQGVDEQRDRRREGARQGAGHVGHADEALRLIQQKFGGQAATYARTTSGHYARLKVSLDQVEETIGKALLPTLDHLATKGVKAAGDFQKHWPEIKQDINGRHRPDQGRHRLGDQLRQGEPRSREGGGLVRSDRGRGGEAEGLCGGPGYQRAVEPRQGGGVRVPGIGGAPRARRRRRCALG